MYIYGVHDIVWYGSAIVILYKPEVLATILLQKNEE